MIIILKNIPKTAKAYEVKKFIEPALKGGLFRRNGSIESIFIQGEKDTQTSAVEYHALIRITPDSAAARAIKMLNGKPLKGKRIAVHEFYLRNWRNDPRIYQQINYKLRDRRLGDRRRYHLEKIEDIAYEFTSAETFHRKFD